MRGTMKSKARYGAVDTGDKAERRDTRAQELNDGKKCQKRDLGHVCDRNTCRDAICP